MRRAAELFLLWERLAVNGKKQHVTSKNLDFPHCNAQIIVLHIQNQVRPARRSFSKRSNTQHFCTGIGFGDIEVGTRFAGTRNLKS